MKKMKLELIRGCIRGSLTVDDVQEIDLNDEQRKEVIKKIFESMKPEDLNYLLQWYIEEFGEYECDHEPCECCGDIVERYWLEI